MGLTPAPVDIRTLRIAPPEPVNTSRVPRLETRPLRPAPAPVASPSPASPVTPPPFQPVPSARPAPTGWAPQPAFPQPQPVARRSHFHRNMALTVLALVVGSPIVGVILGLINERLIDVSVGLLLASWLAAVVVIVVWIVLGISRRSR